VLHGTFGERAEAQRVEATVKRRRGMDRLRPAD
jgi:hypothetical protein